MSTGEIAGWVRMELLIHRQHHQLITHLDTLDDAMDDWDDDIGEEQGQVYGDLGQDDRPWDSRRGDERGLHR